MSAVPALVALSYQIQEGGIPPGGDDRVAKLFMIIALLLLVVPILVLILTLI